MDPDSFSSGPGLRYERTILKIVTFSLSVSSALVVLTDPSAAQDSRSNVTPTTVKSAEKPGFR